MNLSAFEFIYLVAIIGYTCLSILLATFNYRARGTCSPSMLNYSLNGAASAWEMEFSCVNLQQSTPKLKNKYCENAIGPGSALSAQRSYILQECQTTETGSKHPRWPELRVFGILANTHHVCWMLGRSISGLTSFWNSKDWIIILFSECSNPDMKW